MELWATNHGAKTESAVVEKSGPIALTRYSPKKADYELLLYAVKGSGHRLSKLQMTTAIDYMAGFFSRHASAKPQSP